MKVIYKNNSKDAFADALSGYPRGIPLRDVIHKGLQGGGARGWSEAGGGVFDDGFDQVHVGDLQGS